MLLHNKHVIIALLVAPVLALLAWFGVDKLLAEAPQPAVAGGVYPLLENPNCRYASGLCEMTNGGFTATLRMPAPGLFELTASHPLQGVRIALTSAAEPHKPLAMSVDKDRPGVWSVRLAVPQLDQRILLVVASLDARFHANVATHFITAPQLLTR